MKRSPQIPDGYLHDLMIGEAVERRFELAAPIEWLSGNGSPCNAEDTRALARYIGLVPGTTPIQSP